MPKISACLIVKNEENNLDRCLSSLIRNKVDEIIVVDTGSNDKSITIAKKYTDKIYFKEWNDNFSEARNYSISKATGDWIFIIDADEELYIQDFKSFPEIISYAEENNYKTVVPITRNYLRHDLKKYDELNLHRIFKKGTIRYYNSVHNQPKYEKPVYYNRNIIVKHYGYLWTPILKEKKISRSLELIKKEYKNYKNKNDLNHETYYYGQILKFNVITNNFYKFFQRFEVYKEVFLKNPSLNTMILDILKDKILFNSTNGMIVEAEEIAKILYKAIDFNPDPALILFFRNMENENYENSELWLEYFVKTLYFYLKDDKNYNFSTIYKSYFSVFLNKLKEYNSKYILKKDILEKLLKIYSMESFSLYDQFDFYLFLKENSLNPKKPKILDSTILNSIKKEFFGKYLSFIEASNGIDKLLILLIYILKVDINKPLFKEINDNMNQENFNLILSIFEQLSAMVDGKIFYKMLKINSQGLKNLLIIFNVLEPFIIYRMNNKDNFIKKIIENDIKYYISEEILSSITKDFYITSSFVYKMPFTYSIVLKNIKSKKELINYNFFLCLDFDPIFKELTYLISDKNDLKLETENIISIFEEYKQLDILNEFFNKLNIYNNYDEWVKIISVFEKDEVVSPNWMINYAYNNENILNSSYDKNDEEISIFNPHLNNHYLIEAPIISIWLEKKDYYYKKYIRKINDNKKILFLKKEFVRKIKDELDKYLDLDNYKLKINSLEEYGVLGKYNDYNFELEDFLLLFPEYFYSEEKLNNMISSTKRSIIVIQKNFEKIKDDALNNFYFKPKYFLKRGFNIFYQDEKHYYLKKEDVNE